MKTKVLGAVIGVLVGISLGQIWLIPNIWVLIYFLVAVSIISSLLYTFKPSISGIVWLVFIFIIIGNWRLSTVRNINQLDLWHSQAVLIKGWIVNDSYLGKTESQAIIKLESLDNNEVFGEVIVSVPPQNYKYGDSVQISCSFSWPENKGYANYLKRLGVGAVCGDPFIENLYENKGVWWQKQLFHLKHIFIERIRRIVPAPASGLLSGLLLGDKTGLSGRVVGQFNDTGLTHIIALSGFNITIIIGALLALLGWLPLIIRYLGAALVVLVFVLLTGAEPSVVRAAIMAGFIIGAVLTGRLNDIAVSLGITAAIMVLFNPEILFGDVGFQLSFVATLGIVYLSPALQRAFSKIPDQISIYLVPTFAAIIAVTPIVAINFDRVSLIAPVANILVLPIIPLTMLGGFIALVLSWINIYIAQAIGWLVWIFLEWILQVAKYLSKLQILVVSVEWFNLFLVILYYGVVIILFWKEYAKTNKSANSDLDREPNNN